jgi:hypothetical protein
MQNGGLFGITMPTLPAGLPAGLQSLDLKKAADMAKQVQGVAKDVGVDAGSLAKSALSFLVKPWVLGIIGVLVAGIGYFIYRLLYPPKPAAPPAAAATAAALGTAAANSPTLASGSSTSGFQSGPETEGFQMPSVPPQAISADDTTFMNLQPLAIKDAGFIGPYPNGKFDPETATGNALKAGFRFLTLQIDYMDSVKDGYEAPNEPTLLIRGSDGSLISGNSGNIAKVAETVANLGFRPDVPHNTQPIILYLHINRSPNKVKTPHDYLVFLSKIAKALAPLAPTHLGLNPLGNFTRQKLESTLLTTPLRSLEGHTIILCNADTTPFRAGTSARERYDPAADLDFWVNMRVYLESEEDALGVTRAATSDDKAHAVIADLDRLLKLSSAKKDSFAEKGKKRYVIAMGARTKNPVAIDLGIAVNQLGLNVIPLDIFTDPTADVMQLTTEYANMPYHPKPSTLRNILP